MKNKKLLFWILFVLGIIIRCYKFTSALGGLNQDEAFAGYEAFSLLNFGFDSHGYKNPLYFVSWGSGMNTLNSYLMIPFIKIFGANAVAVRLPQLILAILSMPVFFLVLKKISGERCALWGLFILVISPWHIMLSKWGLESNIAPALLLLGMFFFIKATEYNRFFILSAIFYGICLYAYATAWLFIPPVILLSVIYAIKFKKVKSYKILILSGVILFIMALPLFVFLIINMEIINEIKTPFFSIPKLIFMRKNEISFLNIFKADTYKNLGRILFLGSDNNFWNSAGSVGIYYFISIPFTVLGAVKCFKLIFKREYSSTSYVTINFAVAIIISLTIWEININKINFIHFPILIFTAVGAESFLKNKKLCMLLLCGYLALFGVFSNYYYSTYAKTFSYYCAEGLSDAAERVKDISGKVFVDDGIEYPALLFYLKEDTDEYVKTKKYINYPAPYMYLESFGRYYFTNDFSKLDENAVYIAREEKLSFFEQSGFTIEKYKNVIICYKSGT